MPNRPVLRQDVPPAYPHVCIVCGHGAGPYREFFIDLGFDITTLYQPIREGAVYLCNACAPSIVDGIILIMNSHANAVMDDRLVKEEATYGTIDRISGGRELSGVSSTESSRSVSERLTDRGLVQGMDQVENLPDSYVDPNPPASLGTLTTADSTGPTTDEPEEFDAPTFVMGKRVDRTNRPG